MAIQNDLILRAARGERTERVPVWLMRQAGRILPEYRAIRSKLSGFKELVQTPELACEVTLQPVDILGVDAAIIFSDILVIPEAMGLDYEMIKGKGPHFEKTIRTQEDLKAISVVDPEEKLAYVMDAIRLTKKELNNRVPLIGFAGAPWTIFCYMTEGQGSKTFALSRKLLVTEPEMAQQLIDDITETTISYLKAQIAAGADMVQVFDSWAGVLSADLYKKFALPAIRKICNAIDEVPVTVFAKGAYFVLQELGQLNCETIGLDWNMDPESSRKSIGNDKTLQGNLDPAVLYGNYDRIRMETTKMLQSFGGNRHIANLGHGVYPDTHPDHVKCFIDTVKEFKF